MLMWIVVIANISGAVMVAAHEPMLANKIWCITNPILIGYNFYLGAYEQMFMFAIYWILCLLGITRSLQPIVDKIKARNSNYK